MSLTDFVQDLQVKSDKIPFVKWICRPFSRLYFKYIDHSHSDLLSDMQQNFRAKGLKTLKYFDETMTSNGYVYSLAFGTMLGAVREHGFIQHDLDIDVFMWKEDVNDNLFKVLQKAGFKIYHSFLVEDGKYGREDTVVYDGVHIDIFCFYPKLEGREYPYCCDFFPYKNARSWEQSIRMFGGVLPRRLEMPSSRDVVRVPFQSLSLPVLANAHEFLSFRYGPNYMTPDPTWSNGDNPYIIPWPEKLAKYIKY